MKKKKLPIELRKKVTAYLRYNLEQKKYIKIEESSVMRLLNDDLKGKLTVYLNGKIL